MADSLSTPAAPDLDLGQLIYDLRIEAGLSQRELAERMGTTQSVISRLEEGGGARNRIDTLARVARLPDPVPRADTMDAGSPQPLLVTVDTILLDEHRIADLRSSAEGTTVELATVTVNERERGVVDLDLRVVPETMVWDESRWDEAVWGGPIAELF